MVACVVNRYSCTCSSERRQLCPAEGSKTGIDIAFPNSGINLSEHLAHERKQSDKQYLFFVYKRYSEEQLADPTVTEVLRAIRAQANREYFAVLRTLQKLDLVRDSGYIAAVKTHFTFGLCGCHLSSDALNRKQTKTGKVSYTVKQVSDLKETDALRLFLTRAS